MARLARIAVPKVPYHVTQRGNRRQPVFFRDDDYRLYLQLLQEQSTRWRLQVWAYCLMTNHVHLIVYPETTPSLTRAVAETHRRYTRAVNFRDGWRGYLWQSRFASVPLDEAHLLAAVRYVERNPVDAGLATDATAYPWSSARAHVTGHLDSLLTPTFLSERIRDWATFLSLPDDAVTVNWLERQLRTGRPLGEERFLQQLEHQADRHLRKQKPGPKLAGVK